MENFKKIYKKQQFEQLYKIQQVFATNYNFVLFYFIVKRHFWFKNLKSRIAFNYFLIINWIY